MPKNVQMPDGKIVEFPDNMSDAEVSNAIRTSNRPGVPGVAKPELRKLGMLDPGGGHSPDELLRGAGAGIKALVNPKTWGGLAQPGIASGMSPMGEGYPAFGPGRKEDMEANRAVQLDAQQGQREQAKFIGQNPMFSAGAVAGPALLTHGIAKGAPALGSAIRTAAIGDTDAAALRGLRVPPSSPKSIRTVSAVEGSRPFLQGAKNLEDLQAKIPAAKNEIWGPYKQTVDSIGDKPVQGPDGPTTVKELENQRLQLSALNRALKAKDPQAIQTAQQKGLTQAQLLDQEKAVQRALDPHLEQAGIDPGTIRKAFGQIATVEGRVAGRSTIAEPKQAYGLSKLKDASLIRPLSNIPLAGDIARDIAAGRYMSASPTDVNIREAFRTGGPKPDFRAPISSMPRAEVPPLQLPSSTIPNAEVSPSPKAYLGSGSPKPVDNPIIPHQRQLLQLPASTAASETQPMIQTVKPQSAPADTSVHIFPPGSQFRNVQETPYYPPGSMFRKNQPSAFDLDEYLRSQP